jgi:flagellar biosynthesis protein FlhF
MKTIRTFTAKDVATAVSIVKREMGAHAVVLHSRTIPRGGLWTLMGKTLIEVTAADGRELAKAKRREAEHSPRAEAIRSAQARQHLETETPPLAGDLIRRTYQAARSQFQPVSADRDTVDMPLRDNGLPAPEQSPNVVAVAPAPASADSTQVTQELAAVRQLVEQVAKEQKLARVAQTGPDVPDPLVEYYAKLIEQEVTEDLAQELMLKLNRPDQDQELGRDALLEVLTEALPTCDQPQDADRPSDGRPRIIALVGPTGVGKTTTVAKLAATFKLKQNKSVGLITADTYRIAAVEQLRTYAGIIGLPLEVVTGPDALGGAMARLSHCDIVLVDTAGRSQRDGNRLDELKSLLQAIDPHETHLVLSSTASCKVLDQVVQRFAQIDVDRLIFTKLDEAVTCGAILNITKRLNKPLSYFTTGQEVPHQIEPGQPRRLAEMLLGMEAAE